jgi:hypothetical protein
MIEVLFGLTMSKGWFGWTLFRYLASSSYFCLLAALVRFISGLSYTTRHHACYLTCLNRKRLIAAAVQRLEDACCLCALLRSRYAVLERRYRVAPAFRCPSTTTVACNAPVNFSAFTLRLSMYLYPQRASLEPHIMPAPGIVREHCGGLVAPWPSRRLLPSPAARLPHSPSAMRLRSTVQHGISKLRGLRYNKTSTSFPRRQHAGTGLAFAYCA